MVDWQTPSSFNTNVLSYPQIKHYIHELSFQIAAVASAHPASSLHS